MTRYFDLSSKALIVVGHGILPEATGEAVGVFMNEGLLERFLDLVRRRTD